MVVEAPDIIKEHNGSFYCLECPFVAGQLEVVETHANGHLEKFSYICDKCQWTTDDNEELKLHEQCHSFEMVNDENEESVGEKLMWNCEECPYKSLDVYEMRSHTRLHQGKRSQKCGQCTFSCDTPGTLSQHIQVHGKVSKRGKPKRNNIKRENITDKVISKDIMTKNENGVPVKALKLVVKSVNLKEPYEMHKCETCPYYASSEDSIFKHVALHNSPKGNKKMHECLNCKFWCDSNEMLLDHIKVHNNAFNIPYFIQTLFACKNCDFTCSEESVLKLHEQKLNCTSNKRPVRGRKRKLADDEDTPVTENSTREVSIDDADSMTLDDWLKEYHKKFGLPRGIIEIKTKAVAKERPRHNVLDLYSSRINCQVDDYYKCDKCPFTTKFEPVMRGHEVHHIHPQQHSCSLCSYSVNDVRNLISHLKWHETDNGFGEIDKKSTLKKNDPYREINCHPGMDAYECPFNPCTFRTSFAHTINSHITEHAKKHKLRILTGLKRKNIDCQKNDKTFKPPKESKNPLMCSDCQFSTHFSDEIVDHNESHKDPFLEYQCTLCTFASDSLVSLSTHFTDHHTEEVKGKENDLTNLNERQKRFKTYLEHLIQVTPV
uniref:C2H2-type domain-containing protein n=1 Tax=Parastrongyloides trichosuri TaxID=131310 RepID=A0A0N4Z1X7_PARTI